MPLAGDNDADQQQAPDPHRLAQDWITLWQSEVAALAADKEAQETWQALAGLWAGMAAACLQSMPHEPPP